MEYFDNEKISLKYEKLVFLTVSIEYIWILLNVVRIYIIIDFKL